MTSSFTQLNHVGNGSDKANGIDKHNIIEARRQFQQGSIRAAYQKNHPKTDDYNTSSGLYIAQLSKIWDQPAYANIDARPLRNHDRIPVRLENSTLIFACVSALQLHLGLSKDEISDIANNGGLDIDFINNFAPEKIAALYDELRYDSVA